MACDGCTCGRANENGGNGNGPTSTTSGQSVQLPRVAAAAKSFTSPADGSASEGVEPAKPLRSKFWFNDPHDPG